MSIEKWVSEYITMAEAGDYVVKENPGKVAEILVETSGLTCYLKDGSRQAYSALTGLDQDDWNINPVGFQHSIVLHFDSSGSASIVYL